VVFPQVCGSPSKPRGTGRLIDQAPAIRAGLVRIKYSVIELQNKCENIVNIFGNTGIPSRSWECQETDKIFQNLYMLNFDERNSSQQLAEILLCSTIIKMEIEIEIN
jgi:hypothetical protein